MQALLTAGVAEARVKAAAAVVLKVSCRPAVPKQTASAVAASAGASKQQQHQAASGASEQLTAGLGLRQRLQINSLQCNARGAGCRWLNCWEASYMWAAWRVESYRQQATGHYAPLLCFKLS